MAAYRWAGTTDGDWKKAANWRTLAGAAVVNYPGDTGTQHDDVYIDTALIGGAVSPAGVSGLTEPLLNYVFIGGTFDGTVGSAPAPVEIDIDGTGRGCMIEAASAGNIYLKGGGVGATDSLHSLTIRAGTVYLDGYVQQVRILKGTVSIAATTIFGTSAPTASVSGLYISYITSVASDANVTIAAGAALPSYVHVNGGVTTCGAALTDLWISAGTWTQNGAVSDAINLFGGTVNWSSGTVTNAVVMGGTLDGSDSNTPRTLTAATLLPGGTINLNTQARNITLTSPGIVDLGGTITWPTGEKVNRS